MCVFNCSVTWYEKCNIRGLHAAVGLKTIIPVYVSHAPQLVPEQTARQTIWHVCFKMNSTKYTYPYCNLAEYYTFKRASDETTGSHENT